MTDSKFNSFGTLSSVARKTLGVYKSEDGNPVADCDAWDYFLKSVGDTFPAIVPSAEEIESDEFLRDYPCEDLDFRVFQNIIAESEIIRVNDSYVSDDLFVFLDAYNIREIRISVMFGTVERAVSFFGRKGWKLESYDSKVALFKAC